MNVKSVDFDNESDDLSEEENVAIGKLEFWQITVHVHGKEVNVSCGDATQRLKWLAHVAIGELTHVAALNVYHAKSSFDAARWDEEHCQGWKRLGVPSALRLGGKDGDEIDMALLIKDVLRNRDHVFVETSLAPTDTK